MSSGVILLAIFLGVLLFAPPRDELKFRAIFLVMFVSVILFILWLAPDRFEADIRDIFGSGVFSERPSKSVHPKFET